MTPDPRVTILCAVAEIREFHAEDAFLMAVGEWLESVADRSRTQTFHQVKEADCRAALTTARAFLDRETTR